MKLFVLTHQNSIANHFVAELRNIHIQTERLRFRRNLERLGEILAYEVSKTLAYTPTQVQTPLATTQADLIPEQPILITILRAGLPFYQGFLHYFDQADSGFVGAYRAAHGENEDVHINMEYFATPSLQDRNVIIIDPMLATGKSIVQSCQRLFEKSGKPASLHIASVIASPQGVDYIHQHLPEAHIWTAALDQELNAKAYIVPGLGDAGDLSFGDKL